MLDLAPDAAELDLDLEHVLELAGTLLEDLGDGLLLGLLVLDPGLDVVVRPAHQVVYVFAKFGSRRERR